MAADRKTDARIDISRQITEICELLGIEHDATAQLTLKELDVDPVSVVATFYKRNNHGSFYTTANGIAAETCYFKVRT